MVTKVKRRRAAGSKKRFIGKPTGQIQDRVQEVGPEHFGIVSVMHTQQWKGLNSLRESVYAQVRASEQEMVGFLVQTPYVLLLSVTGINVVSASRLAGEAGPIEHDASARAITGRAGLYPSRYQSDEVDHADGSLIRQCNRKLRGAAMLVAENLIKCHPYYRGLSANWAQQKVDPRNRRCRVANRAMRMVYQIVGGRQLWRGKGVDREYLLAKLQEFHRTHAFLAFLRSLPFACPCFFPALFAGRGMTDRGSLRISQTSRETSLCHRNSPPK